MYRKRALGGKMNQQQQIKNKTQSAAKEQQKSLRQSKDNETIMVDSGDIGYEMRCVLYNVGAAHSRLAAAQDRSPPLTTNTPTTVGAETPSNTALKIACTHLQCAAWAFEVFFKQLTLFVSLFT